jgi:hypothetical protein
MKILKWVVFVLLVLFFLAWAVSAQSVSPLVAEGGKGKAKGEFVVTNNSVQPLVVTIQALSFKLTNDGHTVYLPLDVKSVALLSETSARVGAKQTHSFGYRVECLSTEPCLICFLPRMVSVQHVTSGMQLGIIIPHSVYLCPDSAKHCRDRVRRAAGIPDGK